MNPRTILFTITLTLLLVFTQANNLEALNYNSNGGDRIAIMTSGDVEDFGYNYIINAGRVEMERSLNMSNSFWLPNIKDNVTAIAKGIEMVQKGCKLVMSCTFSHGTAMATLANMYPNVSFVRYTTSKTTGIPNLSSAGYLNPEFWFAVGVFSGITSLNDKVGFVHPGPTPGTIQSINAFYSGVKYANSSVSVHVMYSGAFIAADRAQGASDHLIKNIQVGSLTGQQDDLTVPRAAMNAGLLGIGVTGYSLRSLYGELVGISFLRDWRVIMSKYAALSIGEEVFSSDSFSKFNNGGQFPDKKSYLVSDEQYAVLERALADLMVTPDKYLCGSWMSQFSTYNPETDCVTLSQFNTAVYPGVDDLGYYSVPLSDKPFPSSSRVGIIVTTGILLAIPVILVLAVIILRNNKEIQSGSPFFFLIMLAGCILVYIGVLIWPLEPSENRCYARIWLPSIGATLAISALITKNLRIFLLFFNPFKFRGENLKIKYYIPVVVVMLIIDIILLIIYTTVGPKGVYVQQGVNGLAPYETRHLCATSDAGNGIIYGILVWHMLQLVIGCAVSFMLRNVTEKQYNERKAVAMAIYVVTFCLLIAAVLIGVTDISNEQTIIFVTLALLVANTGVLLIIFGSRFVNLVMDPLPELRQPNSSSKSSGGSKGSQSKNSQDEYTSATASSRPPMLVYTA